MCEIYSKLTIKTPERRHRRRSGVFIVNFEQISGIVLVFPLLTLTLSRRRLLSYRNQSIDLLRKSMDWFLYDNGFLLERVNRQLFEIITTLNWTYITRSMNHKHLFKVKH